MWEPCKDVLSYKNLLKSCRCISDKNQRFKDDTFKIEMQLKSFDIQIS